jgi:hypothetical protein
MQQNVDTHKPIYMELHPRQMWEHWIHIAYLYSKQSLQILVGSSKSLAYMALQSITIHNYKSHNQDITPYFLIPYT